MPARIRATLLFTGSPRSRCSLAMTKGCLCWRTGLLWPGPRCQAPGWQVLKFFYFVVVFRKKKSVSSRCPGSALHSSSFLSSRGPGPARRVAWVDADRGTQVIHVVANATHHLHSKLFTLHSKLCALKKKTPCWALFNSLRWPPVFCGQPHDDGSKPHVQILLPSFHEIRAYARDVFLTVDMFFLLP